MIGMYLVFRDDSRFKLNLENNNYMNFVLIRINLLVALYSTLRHACALASRWPQFKSNFILNAKELMKSEIAKVL